MSHLTLEAIARRQKPIANQPIELLSLKRPRPSTQHGATAVGAPGNCFGLTIAKATQRLDLIDRLLIGAGHIRRPDVAIGIVVARAFQRFGAGSINNIRDHDQGKPDYEHDPSQNGLVHRTGIVSFGWIFSLVKDHDMLSAWLITSDNCQPMRYLSGVRALRTVPSLSTIRSAAKCLARNVYRFIVASFALWRAPATRTVSD